MFFQTLIELPEPSPPAITDNPSDCNRIIQVFDSETSLDLRTKIEAYHKDDSSFYFNDHYESLELIQVKHNGEQMYNIEVLFIIKK